jgi:hypothetical protein
MNEQEIRQHIETLLVNSTFELTEFTLDPQFFGNMTAVIYNDTKVYKFYSDRGEIWCNHTLIYPKDYHVKGQDDAPEYLLKAIQNLIDEKRITPDQASKTTRQILTALGDLIDLNQVLLSKDVKETKKGPVNFESVIFDRDNKIQCVVYEDGDFWTSFLFTQKYYYALNFESDEEVIQDVITTFTTVYTCPIKYVSVYKGDTLMKRTLYIEHGKQWEWIGVKVSVPKKLINPFAKSITEEVIYDFRKKKIDQ